MTHTMRPAALLAGAALFVLSTTAFTQTRPANHLWSHGTMLSVSAGGSFDGSQSGPLGGASLGWEVLPWFGLEGSGTWLDRGTRANAFAADMKALFGLTRPAPLVPFIEAGVGLYRSSFDRALSPMPAFYGRRMARAPAMNTSVTFTDPSMVVGGGFNIFVTQHAALRPVVETAFVLRDSHSYAVSTVALRMTYHFEDHPITPAR